MSKEAKLKLGLPLSNQLFGLLDGIRRVGLTLRR
jgi:hypothetical protein